MQNFYKNTFGFGSGYFFDSLFWHVIFIIDRLIYLSGNDDQLKTF